MNAPRYVTWLTVLLFGWILAATPAIASSPEGSGDAHAEEAGHGDAGHGEGGHGEDAYHNYWEDVDGDNTPQWLDPTIGEDPNPNYQVPQLLFHLVNLGIVFGVLFVFARRPVLDAVKNRAALIRKELTDTARERDEAKQRYEELEARLDKFEDEIRAMRDEAATEAAAEEAKLIERARREAERIADATDRNIRDATIRARVELRKDAVEIAVKLARQILTEKVNEDDQQRLARAFLDSLNEGASADA